MMRAAASGRQLLKLASAAGEIICELSNALVLSLNPSPVSIQVPLVGWHVDLRVR